jgi:predicted ATP-binding protein involved in virulence
MIDEVDMHLHPDWQQTVLTDLMAAFPRLQFIVTTHSPQVLSTIRRENIRVLRATDTGHEAVVPEFSPLAHESGDALSRIMGTHRQPPLALLDTVRAYEQLVRAGQESSEEACQLKAELDEAGYQIHGSELETWRFMARYQARAQG